MITQLEYVSVALSIQHALRMRHIVICDMPPIYNNFLRYLINGTIFEKKLLDTKCVFWFSLQLLSETFFILGRNERDMVKSVYRSSCKVPVIFVRFWRNLNFLDIFSKKILKYQNLRKCWYLRKLYQNLTRNSKFAWSWTKISGTSYEDKRIYVLEKASKYISTRQQCKANTIVAFPQQHSKVLNCWQREVSQQYHWNALLRYHGNPQPF
jgi:hypothetical protein